MSHKVARRENIYDNFALIISTTSKRIGRKVGDK